jgi:hypothetical protein
MLGIELEPSLLSLAHDMFTRLKLAPERFRICTDTAPDSILSTAMELGKFRRIKEVRLSGGKELHPKDYDSLVEAISINNRLAWRNRMTLVRLGRLWVKNVITNLATLPWEQVAPPMALPGPIMLCGAGPSLNNVLPWIKEHFMYMTIIAVDTAAGTLAQAGIRPDQVVCLEAQAHNLPDFVPLTGIELSLVADISAHPASFRIVQGQKNLVSSQWLNTRFLDRLASAGLPIQSVPPLGSVGVLAARLAVQQRQVIFLAGLDFAFQRAITHCKGSPSDLNERRLETRLYKHGRNWALSFGQDVVATSSGSLGNAILSMYASCAGIELKGAEVYDLRGGFGLPLPATAISLEQASKMLAGQNDSSDTTLFKNATSNGYTELYRGKALAFLENELRLARELSHSLRRAGGESLAGIIKDCDYMYAHFPDPERVETLEIDALKRLALESGYWQARLQTALAFMNS